MMRTEIICSICGVQMANWRKVTSSSEWVYEHSCETCDRASIEVRDRCNKNGVWLISSKEDVAEFLVWVEKGWLPTLESHLEIAAQRERESWNDWLVEFRVRYPEHKEYPVTQFIDSLSEKAKSEVNARLGVRNFDPKDIEFYPPQIPLPKGPNPSILVLQDGNWVELDRERSEQSHILEAPSKIRAREKFQKILTGVFGSDLPSDLKEVENQYQVGGNPWIQFSVSGVEFTIGDRKRVVEITVNSKDREFLCGSIRDLSLEDSVTYYAFAMPRKISFEEYRKLLEQELTEDSKAGARGLIDHIIESKRKENPEYVLFEDGGWRDNRTTAARVIVHAWTAEKAEEYLKLLVEAARV